ncbi:MAG: hypothetical protein ABIH64_02720 [Nanoarchaeota archaeon]
MSLLEKLESKSEEKATDELRKREIEKQVAKQREYDKLGLIGD